MGDTSQEGYKVSYKLAIITPPTGYQWPCEEAMPS